MKQCCCQMSAIKLPWLLVWCGRMALSCWNHMLPSFAFVAGRKFCSMFKYQSQLIVTAASFSAEKQSAVMKLLATAHHTVTLSVCNSPWYKICGFSPTQNLQFCSLMFLDKAASSEKTRLLMKSCNSSHLFCKHQENWSIHRITSSVICMICIL